MPLVRGVVHRTAQFPRGRVNFREVSIRLKRSVYPRKFNGLGIRQGLVIDFTPSYNKSPFGICNGFQGCLKGVYYLAGRVVYRIILPAGHDNMIPFR